jgi:hydroxymethylbilane synthase
MAYRLRIGSRPSPLALVQANAVKRAIEGRIGADTTTIVPISTSGDRTTSASLARIGGKGLFVRELEQALTDRRIDLAVHSLKDLPAVLPDQFRIAAIPKREDPRDALLVRKPPEPIDERAPWQALKSGARVGTASPRRKYELLRRRQDLVIDPLRGNVDTRLRRLAEGDFDAIMVAIAGLNRLGKLERLEGIALAPLNESDFVPAGGQAALAIEALRGGLIGGERELDEVIAQLEDMCTRAEVVAERCFLATIGASCISPVGVRGTFADGHLSLHALLFSTDGGRHMSDTQEASIDPIDGRLEMRASECGQALGQRMLAAGADSLMAEP